MSGDGFLERWSRLKRGAAVNSEAAAPGAEAETETEAVEPALSEAEIAVLPPVESIMTRADLQAFLRRGVPPLLRRAALRRMWRVDPRIRDYLDDARDYAFDWNAPGRSPSGPLTAERAAALMTQMFPPKTAADAPRRAEAPAAAAPPPAPLAATEAVAAVAAPAPERGPTATASEEAPATPQASRRRHGGAAPA